MSGSKKDAEGGGDCKFEKEHFILFHSLLNYYKFHLRGSIKSHLTQLGLVLLYCGPSLRCGNNPICFFVLYI